VSYADDRGDFGSGNGGYKLKETTGTLYAGYGTGPWYFGATAGAGDLDFSDVRRNITLGATVRTEAGETRGWHAMGSVLGGYWFTYGNWLHGPFARLAYQEIHVRGFAERGSDSSALRYGEQERKSFVTGLGWQVAGRSANVQPCARVTWTFENKDDDRFVDTSSVTLGGNYSVHVIKPDRDYVQYLVGASADFGHVTGWRRTLTLGQKQASTRTWSSQHSFAAIPRQSTRRGFLGAPANRRSYSGRGSRRSARPANAICHGRT
jgi:outer membrane lipase/esterase